MEYNTKLLELYQANIGQLIELFKELNSSKNEADRNFSWPLLLRIWEKEYESAPVKLMVFGQETNGWPNQTESHIENNTPQTLTEEYILHDMGRDRTRSPFWRTVHQVNHLMGNPDNNCFVWNNILKFGKESGCGYPSDAVMSAEMKYFNVISKEVEIINPDVCLFLIGPNYDTDIKLKFTDAEFLSVEGFTSNQLVQIKSKGLPEKSFRTYHPRYGCTKKELYDEILQTIVRLSKDKA